MAKNDNREYPVLIEGPDFTILSDIVGQGKHDKKMVRLKSNNEVAILKYQIANRNVSEDCSEKLAYELARELNIPAARVELATDSRGKQCSLSYFFANKRAGIEHQDAIRFLKRSDAQKEKDFCTLSNIKNSLDFYSTDLFPDFIKIMFFDILVGEVDRHEENWGIIRRNGGKYEISPLYDTACCLLPEFRDPKAIEKYSSGRKDFDAYIRRGRTRIFTDAPESKRFKFFDLASYLYQNFQKISIPVIDKIIKLQDNRIKEIVYAIPSDRMSQEHKNYIIKYLIKRKDILKELINE